MKGKRDAALIGAIVVVALVMLLFSRTRKAPDVEQFVADVTLAPDAITYLDATAAPVATGEAPTAEPAQAPTEAPTEEPTEAPTEAPTAEPTQAPTEAPTEKPTDAPTEAPTTKPTDAPTEAPTAEPTAAPTEAPTAKPTEAPTEAPTAEPTAAPTEKPTEAPAKVQGPAGPAGPALPSALQAEKVRGYVRITVGGRQWGDVIPMDREKIITIKQSDEMINQIYISPERVYMMHSTCENQDCVGEGEITPENYKTRILSTFIICLPNSVQIEMIPVED